MDINALTDSLATIGQGHVIVNALQVSFTEDWTGSLAEALGHQQQIVSGITENGCAVLRELQRGIAAVSGDVGDRNHLGDPPLDGRNVMHASSYCVGAHNGKQFVSRTSSQNGKARYVQDISASNILIQGPLRGGLQGNPLSLRREKTLSRRAGSQSGQVVRERPTRTSGSKNYLFSLRYSKTWSMMPYSLASAAVRILSRSVSIRICSAD